MRAATGTRLAAVVCALCALAALVPAAAQAERDLISKEAVNPQESPEGQIEGACGVAPFAGKVYVSAYYQHAVMSFGSPFESMDIFEEKVAVPPEGPCGLAVDSAGALYANVWHESVVRLKPSPEVFDTDSSTGVAVDEAGNVYANDRTRIVKYASSGALIEEIGTGSLGDAYGLAVFKGRVYAPDAASDTVKVFEPAKSAGIVDTLSPPGGFTSLVDASVAVDPTNGNVLVVDNLQPGFEHPNGAIDEFDDEGNFLGQLKEKVIDGGPSGIAVGAAKTLVAGMLFVTSGNTEKSNVFSFGPYTESGGGAVGVPPETAAPPAAGVPVPSAVAEATRDAPGAAAEPVLGPRRPHRHRRAHARRMGVARAMALR